MMRRLSILVVLLGGHAAATADRPERSIAQLSSACSLAATVDEERSCLVRLAVERSKGGRIAEAIADYERELRLGPPDASVLANLAELLMASGRLDEAEDHYRQAISIATRTPRGAARDADLARAHFGRAAALDRAGRGGAAREALAAAVAIDPRLDLLSAPAEGASVFFVPRGDVHYLRGLALEHLGRTVEAAAAFRRYLADADGRYRRQAEAHLASVGPVGAAPPDRPATVRVVAAATVRAEGPLPAPLVDATWRGESKRLEPCFEDMPTPPGPRTVRVALDLQITSAGVLAAVRPALPKGWSGAAGCLEAELKKSLRLPRVSRKEGGTSARVELVLAIRP